MATEMPLCKPCGRPPIEVCKVGGLTQTESRLFHGPSLSEGPSSQVLAGPKIAGHVKVGRPEKVG